jgi:hypothetical protein
MSVVAALFALLRERVVVLLINARGVLPHRGVNTSLSGKLFF